MDPFGFLDDLFGGSGGGGYPTTQGGAPLNHGFSAVQGWAVGQAFSNAGPIGQYLGLLYGSPGTGIQNVGWEQTQANAPSVRSGLPASSGDGWLTTPEGMQWQPIDGDEGGTLTPPKLIGAVGEAATGDTTTAPIVDNAEVSPPTTDRVLEHLYRDGSSLPSAPTEGPIEEVYVFGAPPLRPGDKGWSEDYFPPYQTPGFSGQEIQIDLRPPPRPPRPRQPAARKPSAVDPLPPTVQPPDPNPADGGPYFDVESPNNSVPTSNRVTVPWMSDVTPPEQFLEWGAWERPESVSPPRLERGDVGRIETVPTVTPERSFWDRGGAGLAAGAFIGAVGVGTVMFWNPVGWAAIGAALAIAGGVAATTASAVELSASYGGATSAEQDAQMNRAVSAALRFSETPGGVLGSVIGTVVSDDPEQGFEEGALWGGTLEAGWGIAASLPGALRALPGISRAALPWAKSLLLTPLWFSMSAEGGGGNSLARVFAMRARAVPRFRNVRSLGTTPLLEREADWARYQTFATRTRNEAIFRITYANGRQAIVLADRFNPGSLTILEAKYGDMGQMFDPTREAHIMRQATNYVGISRITGGRTVYLVSTELGATRLTQRFTLDFPSEMASGQLQVDWVRWRR